MQGFIGVHRKLMQNAVWTDPNYLKLWMYCMFKASHKPHEQLVGNQKVQLEKGQFVTGREALAIDMNKGVKPKQRLNDLTWFRYLKNLEKWEMLNIKSNNKFSLVTVANYEFYQSSLKKDEHQTEQQLNNKRTTDEQQMNTNNNVNKGNNENKKDYLSEIKEFLVRYQNIEGFNKLNKEYWAAIRKTRKSGKVAESVIHKNMEKWNKYDPIIVYYSLKTHVEAHEDKEEKYTIGIMRKTSLEEAKDRLDKKVVPFVKKPAVDTKSIFDEYKNREG